ncbi:hypothetical protein AOQ84DRAFT_206150 [Glonium stellatum]|uniref:Uncharacterized protein n=1 Tax=Glonium stellatum TaxID=574774 RepID=A0A8E2EN46_9PEZI|nr:hypothetical protein AOQ84DRAFT_206150 [Glonium stellatum]
MPPWKVKFPYWRKDRHPTGEPGTTGSREAHQAQSTPNTADHVAGETPGSTPSEESAFGIKVLVPGGTPLIDIVAVHGLDGHREKSWTADNGVLWLQVLLPEHIPDARVLTYGYDARTRSSEHLTHQTLYGHSESLISALSLHRRKTKTERRPIIFLAHSLGGIVVKSALIHSNMAGISHNEHLKAIKLSTYGIMFFGTPHQGTDSASWGKVLANVASIFRHTSTAILEHLERDSEWLETQLGQYNSISSEFRTIFCFESYPTPLPAGNSMMMVSRASAVVPGMRDAESVEIRKDHINLVKFRSSSDNDFQTVVDHLSLLCESAKDKVAQNWQHWEEIKALTAETWLNDFEIPAVVSYDRNPNFIGRTKDLDYIHDFLDDVQQEKRRSVPLVLYGTGGIGKTQLVREFLFAHTAMFSSIVWIDARNQQNIHTSFVRFLQKLLDSYVSKSGVTPPPYLRIAQHLRISGLVGEGGQITTDSNALDRIVSACLQWLERKGNTRWLLIFDNVDDLETFDVSDFFPGRKQGCILVTSRRPECRSLGEGWKVEIMEMQESIELLSKSYCRTIEESDNDYEEAKHIVENLGYLPLAIHQAGSYMFMLQKPLRAFVPLFEENFNRTLSKKLPPALWQYGQDTVVTTWEISFEAIRKRDPVAAFLLLLCSFLSNNEISVDFLRRGMVVPPLEFTYLAERSTDSNIVNTLQAVDIDDRLSTLFSFSLADRKRGDSFSIHPIVHWWARERLSAEEGEKLAASALLMIARATKSLQSRDLNTDREVIQHIRVCDNLCKKKIAWGAHYNIEEFWEKWFIFGEMYGAQGHSAEGEDMLKRALAGCKVLKPDHCIAPLVVSRLGLLYYQRGQLEEAEKMWNQALAGYKKVLEPDHSYTLEVCRT